MTSGKPAQTHRFGADAQAAIPGPAIILVEPQMGENIGAAARAMWNFGLEDLRIVNPRDGWPNSAAEAMASGATHVLDRARVCADTDEAAGEISALYATTGRPRELTKRVLTPEEAALEIAAKIAAGEQTGVLFGRERTGLENDDVARANAVIAVPANPAFSSLNLAQCVLLLGYELRKRLVGVEAIESEMGKTDAASREAVNGLYEHLEQELEAARYFYPEGKAPAMRESLRNLLSRTPLTNPDVRMMRGVIRALAEKRRRRE
ncbi:MAG: RNA methyltransferase [Neomegalonema sp.]|nr:RNA methyltransferase [Neomegalonema sp.]